MYHKGQDYIPIRDNEKEYDEIMINQWDRDFFNSILEINDPKFYLKLLTMVDYMMYDTFKAKLSCAIAYYAERYDSINNFQNLFTIINLNDESE